MQSAIAPVVVALCLVSLAFYYARRAPLPPLADAGLVETIRQMTGQRQPWFLLELAGARPRGRRTFRLRLPLAQHWVVVGDAETARLVFASRLEKPRIYAAFDGGTGGCPSLFTMRTGDARWKSARKGVARAFSPASVARALRRGDATLARALDVLDDLAARGEPFEPDELMTELSLDMLGASMLGGFDFGTLGARERGGGGAAPSVGRRYLDDLAPVLQEFALRQANDPLRRVLLRRLPRAVVRVLFPAAAEAMAAAERNMDVARGVIAAFRARRAAADAGERDALDATILGHICANRAYASEEHRAADVQSFLIAGHDTTGYTLAWLLFEVAARPEAQARLRRDLEAADDAAGCNYLNACVHETLRMWPVGAKGSIRETLSRIGPLADGSVIPAGAIVQLPFLVLHRLADVPRADEWEPARWLATDAGGGETVRAPDGLLAAPFSLGPRNCVGQALAMAELRRTAAALVSRYDFEVVAPPTPEHFLTLKPHGGLLRARPRR